MIKHFEELWVAAEQLAYLEEENQLISKIQQLLSDFSNTEDKTSAMGEMIFYLTCLTQKHQINAWTSLLNVMQQKQIKVLGEGEEDDE